MILEVEMVNWRAYEKRTFSFKPGLNFIMGPNGRGKTSILEAIAYALTGEPSVVTDRDQLLRDREKPATVKLTFQVDGQQYRVERTQTPGRAGDAYIVDISHNKSIASTHKKVTEKIEELIGVSADFLQRIVYMAEGDVFRFLKTPPGKAMNQQVQRVLGLTQLDAFQSALKAAHKELLGKSKGLNGLQQRIDELNIYHGQTLEGMIGYLDEQKIGLMKQILELQDELTKLQQETQSLSDLERLIQDQWGNFVVGPLYIYQLEERPLVGFFDDLSQRIEEWRQQQEQIKIDISRRIGQKESFEQIMGILGIAGDLLDGTKCPVCKKPMTMVERNHVIEETNAEIERIDREISYSLLESDRIQGDVQEAQIIIENMRAIRNSIVHGRYREVDSTMTMHDIQKVASQGKSNPRQDEIIRQIEIIQNQVNDLEKARANFVSVRNQLQESGFSSKEEVQDAMVQMEIRQLTLAAASGAADATLADLRDGGLGSIYAQIAAVWDNFIQSGHWSLRFDTDGNPILAEEAEQEFNFAQFSGGEKTALLVIIHTVIAHYFSRCNFLMVDEPLEHLDPVNRRSLMRFFMAACKNKFFDQALITTYEESLVRKYLSEENVNILHIR